MTEGICVRGFGPHGPYCSHRHNHIVMLTPAHPASALSATFLCPKARPVLYGVTTVVIFKLAAVTAWSGDTLVMQSQVKVIQEGKRMPTEITATDYVNVIDARESWESKIQNPRSKIHSPYFTLQYQNPAL